MPKISPFMMIPPVVFAALAGLFFVGMQNGDDALPSTRIGKVAPVLNLETLGDAPIFTADDLADGSVKLVNFWASWCAPCRAEHPNLQMLADEGLAIYGINYKDQPDNALNFLAELGSPYVAMGADTTGRNAINWGVYGVPDTYLIDGNGVVLHRFAGPLTQRSIETDLRPLLDAAMSKTQ